ncbi:MAG: hypothetical protein JNK72_08600 [Myxococcales bacterium]|nr:hypothetical protein [Myxococcales bacterium]
MGHKALAVGGAGLLVGVVLQGGASRRRRVVSMPGAVSAARCGATVLAALQRWVANDNGR